jgi:integrase
LSPASGQLTFGSLANHYVTEGLPFNLLNGKCKADGTIYCYQHILDDFILARWQNEIASKIKPLVIRDWLYEFHDGEDYDWKTVSKIKLVMGQVFDHAYKYELETCRNPVTTFRIPGSEDKDYEARVLQPAETLDLIDRLDYPEKILVLLVAATAVRISEALALQWNHVRFDDDCIQIEHAFRLSKITGTKTKASKGIVPMCGLLAGYLRYWRSQSPYHRDTDFVFASDKLNGRKPRCGQMINSTYLKPAAIAAGVIKEGERFGFHNFRHSLSDWVNKITKDITISQGILRHSKPDITAAVYTHVNSEKNLKAQADYLVAMGLQKLAYSDCHRAGHRVENLTGRPGKPAKCKKRNGRPVGTRTPDLYRVKVAL